MYKRGQLHLGATEVDEFEGDKNGVYTPERIQGKVYLDHSCDEWVIGGAKEVKALISDLQKILKKL